jgi:hypothetical protein
MTSSWFTESEYLVQVACKNEDELKNYLNKAIERGIKAVPFYEPDIDNQLTAIALEPILASQKLIANLPKMLK